MAYGDESVHLTLGGAAAGDDTLARMVRRTSVAATASRSAKPATVLRQLPSVDRVLGEPAVAALAQRRGRLTVKWALQQLQAELRRNAAPETAADGGELPAWATEPASYADRLDTWLAAAIGHGYVPAFNLTGTLLHSNLGRSPIGTGVARRALAAASRPLTLEYDLDSRQRGVREGIVAHRLRLLTGAEHATVVNNNAAAVMLVLNTLALGRNVPVSRGELVEIGGSFRLPELMARAGCQLREVGTTNRTHARDYENAIDDNTALLLKAHPSNYQLQGFVAAVSLRDMAAVAHHHGLPACIDAGSGVLTDLGRFNLPPEPTPRQLLADGADLVTFSGDKLLGGCQAGIIVGQRAFIDRLNANPMKRALRLDKLALAMLDETLLAYENGTEAEHIPLLAMLGTPVEQLEQRAEAVQAVLARLPGATVAIEPAAAQLGSGALPGEAIESRAVTIAFTTTPELNACDLALRRLRPAVLGRLAEGRLWLDMRGAEPLDELMATLAKLPNAP